MFDLSNVKEGGSGVNETYIYPGVRNNVKIVKWAAGKSAQGTDYVSVFLQTKQGKEANVEPTEFRFYVSEKALPTSLSKIKHIVTKVATEEKFASVQPSNVTELVEHLNDVSRGGVLRMRFNGEQYVNSAGEVKEKAVIGLPEFAEAIEEGAQYPPVANADTKLVFDKTKHLKLLDKKDATPEAEVEQSTAAQPSW